MADSFAHVHLVAVRHVAETVRTHAMRAAAEHLNVAPSAVNRQILKLEDQLQRKLFLRHAGGMRPTAAGEVLLHHDTLRREHDLEHAIARSASIPCGIRPPESTPPPPRRTP